MKEDEISESLRSYFNQLMGIAWKSMRLKLMPNLGGLINTVGKLE